jgi:leucyl-tRNA synthetase
MYELDQDFQWYQKRTAEAEQEENSAKTHVIGEVLDAQIRMLAPIAPHMCEELWEMIGRKSFVSTSSWPTSDEAKVDVAAEENEDLIMNMLEDTSNIIKATGIRPKKICYYTPAPWKWKTYLKALEKSVAAKVVQGDLIRELLKDSDLKARAKEVAEFVGKIVDEANRVPEERKQRLIQVGVMDENWVLKEAEDFLKRELNAEIHIYNEENTELYDPKKRAQTAKPYRPAIFIE